MCCCGRSCGARWEVVRGVVDVVHHLRALHPSSYSSPALAAAASTRFLRRSPVSPRSSESRPSPGAGMRRATGSLVRKAVACCWRCSSSAACVASREASARSSATRSSQKSALARMPASLFVSTLTLLLLLSPRQVQRYVVLKASDDQAQLSAEPKPPPPTWPQGQRATTPKLGLSGRFCRPANGNGWRSERNRVSSERCG